ncbi:uncharacterized protein ColSpa_11837 [Colletotrichum spaethianum]|uniref:GED domain-containing protein n=1 Tax=Colletotrichum spaethianum TaxID=700344 RepID=A0AA37PG33_9PEZI|nr:uncharacterized protein ColSpa_11837 [Colletotrichum spaethianum]GKT51656.1 hypothetical protein ColSpa_11837 [Colletotrichum spaethianum]
MASRLKEAHKYHDVINKLHLQGLSDYTSLPRVVLCRQDSTDYCGCDPLKDLTGINVSLGSERFNCYFIFEIVLRPPLDDNPDGCSSTITIIPSAERSEEEKATLLSFAERSTTDISSWTLDLDVGIDAAKQTVMSFTFATKLIVEDVIRIEVCKARVPLLSIIALPPLLDDNLKFQPAAYPSIAEKKILKYIRNPRDLILVVACQICELDTELSLLELVRQVDPNGERTFGIFQSHRRNKSWHTVMDLISEDFERVDAYRLKDLMDVSNVGFLAVKDHLTAVFEDHARSQLYDVKDEIKSQIVTINVMLQSLSSNLLVAETKQAMETDKVLSELVQDAVDGNYTNPFFSKNFSELPECKQPRLRTIILELLASLGKRMSENGHAVEIVDFPHSANNLQAIYRYIFVKRVDKMVKRCKGREAPGTLSSRVISELLAMQCNPWKGIIQESLRHILDASRETLEGIVSGIVSSDAKAEVLSNLTPFFEGLKSNIEKEIGHLLDSLSSRWLINSYPVIEAVQQIRLKREKARVQEHLDKIVRKCKHSNPPGLTPDLTSLLVHNITLEVDTDLDRVASELAIDYMQAHYQLALPVMIHEFHQIIENSVLQKLPDAFAPTPKPPSEARPAQTIGQSEALDDEVKQLEEKKEFLQRCLCELTQFLEGQATGLSDDSSTTTEGRKPPQRYCSLPLTSAVLVIYTPQGSVTDEPKIDCTE